MMKHKQQSFPLRRCLNLTIFPSVLLLLTLATLASSQQPKGSLRVAKVVDGDTVVLSDGRTVRYIGIDTPEKGQPFYDVATNFNRRLVKGKEVELEFDIQRYDRYGRLLAYVFVKDGKGKRIFVNAELVKNGYATVYTVPPNVKYTDLFVKLQEEARKKGLGLWVVYKGSSFSKSTVSSPVVGNSRTLIFHRPNCQYASRMSPRNRVNFSSAEGALRKGFRPCRVCNP